MSDILQRTLIPPGLREAAQSYFKLKDIDGMFKRLQPLHQSLLNVRRTANIAAFDTTQGPGTLSEMSFTQAYVSDLQEAQNLCNVRMLNWHWLMYF